MGHFPFLNNLTFSPAYVICHFYCLLILLKNFANILDPDQARQNVGPNLDPKLFDTLIVFLKDLLFHKVNLNISCRQKNAKFIKVYLNVN